MSHSYKTKMSMLEYVQVIPVTECIFARDANKKWIQILLVSVPDTPDPHVYGPPRSGSISQMYGSGSSSKNSKKNLDSYCVVTSFGLFFFEK